MSNFSQSKSGLINKDEPKVSFAIIDTEFLIRLILANKIDGKDVEIASRVLGKIKKVHEKLIMKSQEIL
ncbi:hypothetical protein OAN76_02585 [Candidatus Marinimicrobia bacterium]|nr:hypothetical protein [Candidatus Neomarinimicrobiota bacterium]|tara:strand:- start:237 stop:443 length:207 start_codon:yes stop_codon:yes gene_type:complete